MAKDRLTGAELPAPLRLHLGGEEARAGWSILNAQAKPGVDFVGTCVDLSRFPDGCATEVYASHVYEHLDYVEVERAFAEAYRVLKAGGLIRVSVPDLRVLAGFLADERSPAEVQKQAMMMVYGGQTDAFDYHKAGFTWPLMKGTLEYAGFRNVRKVEEFGLFADTSAMRYGGRLISLNVQAVK